MNFIEALNKAGKTVNDITEIYRGKDRYCRCGCGGCYFHPGDRGFKRAINDMIKLNLESEWDENYPTFINMNYDNSTNEGKALTCYFD